MLKWIKVGSNALETWSEETDRTSRICKDTLKIQKMKTMKPKKNINPSISEEEDE